MRGKIALEEHVSTPQNNRLWDATGEAARNGSDYMKDVERRLLIPIFNSKRWLSEISTMLFYR